MNRLEGYIRAIEADPLRDDYVQYPEDIARLKATVPELNELPDECVDVIWSDYSSVSAAASFLDVDSGGINGFRAWLTSECGSDPGFAMYGKSIADPP